jgi:hypothetical protein
MSWVKKEPESQAQEGSVTLAQVLIFNSFLPLGGGLKYRALSIDLSDKELQKCELQYYFV